MRSEHKISIAVVAPTHNNARTLRDVLTRSAESGLPMICVNDGCTDDSAAILGELAKQGRVSVVTHARNCGKATALLSGFAAAAAAGHTHALTIDTDGQLDPAEIPKLIALAEAEPNALVVGVRDDTTADYPARSRTGRRVSNLLVWLETGVHVSDSQCGFRVYPLELVSAARCRAKYFGFETEIITRAGWMRCPLREASVTCRYLPPGERVSHFRPWLDSFRAVAMHIRLIGRAMIPWPYRHWPVSQADQTPNGPLWRQLLEWINPVRAWRELRSGEIVVNELATGLAVGVFIGNLPVYGVQTVLSLYTARRLHLHPLSVVAGSHISTPPLGPLLIALAIGVGHWILHGRWLVLPHVQATWRAWAQLASNLMVEWSIGAILVGFVLAVASYLLSSLLLRRVAVPAARD